MKVENGFYVRELENIPFDKAFILEDGNECLCHSTGIEVCDIEDNPAFGSNWWNEYQGRDGNLYYGR